VTEWALGVPGSLDEEWLTAKLVTEIEELWMLIVEVLAIVVLGVPLPKQVLFRLGQRGQGDATLRKVSRVVGQMSDLASCAALEDCDG
jgi:hypothetical protein